MIFVGSSVKNILKDGARALEHVSASAKQDIRILLCHAITCTPTDLILKEDYVLTDTEHHRIMDYITQRKAHKPVAQIIGFRWFYGRSYNVTSDVLDPRPESELLIEKALLQETFEEKQRVLDLGTGSGCLLVTYLLEKEHATGVAVDISDAALKTAERNAIKHGVHSRCSFVKSNWTTEIAPEKFDIILCNPPYIAYENMKELEPVVKLWEPHTALFSGENGLEAFQDISLTIRSYMKPKTGVAFFEIGEGQENQVANIFAAQNFEISSYKDLDARIRCIRISL